VRRLVLPLVAAAIALSSPARADEDDNPPRPRPLPPDTRTGRPTLALSLAQQRPFGESEPGVIRSDAAYWGWAPGAQLAVPISRHVALDAWGSYGSYGSTDACPTCKGTSLSIGAGAVYHLVDGIAFDPWFSAGIGYRKTRLDLGPPPARDYTGIDFLRLAFGSDYYPARYIGFGPFFDVAIGRDISRTPGSIQDPSTHLTLSLGLRVVLNPFLGRRATKA
jgi:hypothetical protein